MPLQVKSVMGQEHDVSTFESLTGPEPTCIGLMQLVEALVRRRVSNLQKMVPPTRFEPLTTTTACSDSYMRVR